MNEHQLLCFLTVSRTLNFSAAARELYCTQPALSYQIRSLEKELDAALFRRTTTQVALTEAGRALLPHAENIYRGILNARTALKGFGTHHTLTLRLPPVLLQRDPIYPILMARLHAALPGYEFKVDTTPVPSSYHHMLCTEADAALYLPFGPLPPEIRCETIIGNRFYLIAAPEHPFSGQSSVELSDLAGQQSLADGRCIQTVQLEQVPCGAGATEHVLHAHAADGGRQLLAQDGADGLAQAADDAVLLGSDDLAALPGGLEDDVLVQRLDGVDVDDAGRGCPRRPGSRQPGGPR